MRLYNPIARILGLLQMQSAQLTNIERRLAIMPTLADLDTLINALPSATEQAITTTLVPALTSALVPVIQSLQQKGLDTSSEVAQLQAFPAKVGSDLAASLPAALTASLNEALANQSGSNASQSSSNASQSAPGGV